MFSHSLPRNVPNTVRIGQWLADPDGEMGSEQNLLSDQDCCGGSGWSGWPP